MGYNKAPYVILVTILIIFFGGCIVKSYDASPELLSLGETVTLESVTFQVEEYELRDEFFGNHDLNIFYNADGNKFLYVLVKAENMHSTSLEVPSQYDVKILYQNRPYRSEVNFNSEEREMYEYNWLEEELIEPGHSREGWILFQVPETIDVSKTQLIVDFPHTSYTRTAIWNLHP